MAFKPNNAKSSFSAFNNILGNQEDRRNGNLLGRSADSLYSETNVFAGLEEDDSMDKAINLLHGEEDNGESQEPKEEIKEAEVIENPEEVTAKEEVSNITVEDSSGAPVQEKTEIPKAEKAPAAREKVKKSTAATTRVKKEKKTEKESKSIENFYCGAKMFDDITENSYMERKKKVAYLNDLIRKEVELFEKDKDQYIASRRKKVEALKKAEKGERKAIQVHLDESNALFLEDVQYDVRANKSQFFCAIVAIDTDRIEKKRKNEGR